MFKIHIDSRSIKKKAYTLMIFLCTHNSSTVIVDDDVMQGIFRRNINKIQKIKINKISEEKTFKGIFTSYGTSMKYNILSATKKLFVTCLLQQTLKRYRCIFFVVVVVKLLLLTVDKTAHGSVVHLK